MESPHPEITGTFLPYLTGDTLLHFTSGLIGKGQCQNGPRLITVVQQIGYLVCQHASLSGTGSGNHQRRAFVVQYRLALTFIQFIQIVCHTGQNKSATKIAQIRQCPNTFFDSPLKQFPPLRCYSSWYSKTITIVLRL